MGSFPVLEDLPPGGKNTRRDTTWPTVVSGGPAFTQSTAGRTATSVWVKLCWLGLDDHARVEVIAGGGDSEMTERSSKRSSPED